MIIVICDVCEHQPPGEYDTMESGGRKFIVCALCQWKPFRVPAPKKAVVLLSDGAASVTVVRAA